MERGWESRWTESGKSWANSNTGAPGRSCQITMYIQSNVHQKPKHLVRLAYERGWESRWS